MTREARVWQQTAVILATKLASLNGHDEAELLIENARLMADEMEPPRAPKVKAEFRIKEPKSDKQLP